VIACVRASKGAEIIFSRLLQPVASMEQDFEARSERQLTLRAVSQLGDRVRWLSERPTGCWTHLICLPNPRHELFAQLLAAVACRSQRRMRAPCRQTRSVRRPASRPRGSPGQDAGRCCTRPLSSYGAEQESSLGNGRSP
jgi:hypothetical protein